MKEMRVSIIALFLVSFCYHICNGQTHHFWSQNYGSQSMLLNGSVIGGVSDLGAVYYNPARLALIKNPAFVISGDVYELNNYNVEDAIGTRADLKQSSFGGAPSLTAGTVKIKSLPNHSFAYAVLLRDDSNFGFNYHDEITTDIIGNIPGDELFEGEVSVINSSKDQWFGGSWSYAVKENFSVGSSVFVSKINSSKGNKYEMRALSNNGSVSIYDYNRNYQLNSYGLILKFGLAYIMENWDLGMTITTPRLKLNGKANYNYQLYFSAPPEADATETYANSYQNDLDLNLKTPLSIGLGASHNLSSKGALHLSAEYFHKVNNFDVFTANPHPMQSNLDSTVNFTLEDGYKSILNIGVGTEWYLSEKVSVYGGVSTDFNASPKNTVSFVSQNERASNLSFDANYYHFGAGTVLKFKGAEFTLGATHTSGKSKFSKPVNLPINNGPSDVITDDSGQFQWKRWQFIVSVSVPFLRDYMKKIEDKLKGNEGSN
ncbi:OmpP1/FadL family transporter [Echinicola sp. 20G]|uniref:OmpP1/FadL family transporter n=1 Tax=Echinicola sp. 20G TaxID=2781961 RepID=UPI001910FE43|nr:outer membrane protein transport protein [Echinicola sp. 20G]